MLTSESSRVRLSNYFLLLWCVCSVKSFLNSQLPKNWERYKIDVLPVYNQKLGEGKKVSVYVFLKEMDF